MLLRVTLNASTAGRGVSSAATNTDPDCCELLLLVLLEPVPPPQAVNSNAINPNKSVAEIPRFMASSETQDFFVSVQALFAGSQSRNTRCENLLRLLK